jgi:15-cis-phytoene synthase
LKILYDQLSAEISKLTTKKYSTSFSLGILCLDKSIRKPIYQIYGFVRVADEIVDSFHEFNKKELLDEFERETYLSISRKISSNPILNSFQEAVNTYHIDHKLIQSFLYSMHMDLESRTYEKETYDTYIYGSAEVVGLMCLYVFVNGNQKEYELLSPEAKKLGSAFQKINFLRDIHQDGVELGRTYFPNVDLSNFDDQTKVKLIAEIDLEFDEALQGIKKLPKNARFGVYVAYIYYRDLSDQIKNMPAKILLSQRASVSNYRKLWLLIKSYIKYTINQI